MHNPNYSELNIVLNTTLVYKVHGIVTLYNIIQTITKESKHNSLLELQYQVIIS